MKDLLRRWSEDETVGRALIVAGAIFLLVQLLPLGVVSWMRRLWPLIVVALGLLLLWKPRRP